MHPLERWCLGLRHAPGLAGAGWLWTLLRPGYDRASAVLGRRGLRRRINGTDDLLVVPRLRRLTEHYEPAVWAALMAELRPGDTVVDVGAFVGLYSVAVARRLGPGGRVVAFEPDPDSFALLAQHVRLNGVEGRVELVRAAVGERSGEVPFLGGGLSESHVLGGSAPAAGRVPCVTLDEVLEGRRVDVLKVDVEGYEAQVLSGAHRILADPARRPRALFIELHPYAWPAFGTTADELLGSLRRLGYEPTSVGGGPPRVDRWGELVARRGDRRESRALA
jgi:FkbM family methyltransferase